MAFDIAQFYALSGKSNDTPSSKKKLKTRKEGVCSEGLVFQQGKPGRTYMSG